MSTLLEDLREDIARLEKEDPDSWVLSQLRRQLSGYEAASAMGETAEEIYFSGNPVVPTSSSASLDPNEVYTPDHPRYAEAVAENPMLPLQNGLEEALHAAADRHMALYGLKPFKE